MPYWTSPQNIPTKPAPQVVVTNLTEEVYPSSRKPAEVEYLSPTFKEYDLLILSYHRWRDMLNTHPGCVRNPHTTLLLVPGARKQIRSMNYTIIYNPTFGLAKITTPLQKK